MDNLANTLSDEMKSGVETKAAAYSMAEQKALRNYNVSQYKDCTKTFLIKNRKNGRVVEIKAPTAILAATSVGWRPRHTILLEEKTEVVKTEIATEKKET